MTEPMFSVIVPCRDDQSGLNEALGSIINQSSTDFEVIVVDDGSQPPVTVASDSRVRLTRQPVAGGPAAARNRGLKLASGRYVAFCDSDDLFTVDRLRLAAAAHALSPLVVCAQGDLVARVPPSPTGRGRRREVFDAKHPLRHTTPHLGSTSILRERCPEFDERYLACQDIDWWIRLTKTGLVAEYVDEVGYLFRRSERPRILNSQSARIEFSYQLLQDHASFFERDRRSKSFRWTRIAAMERQAGNMGLAVHAVLRAARAWPTLGTVSEALRCATRRGVQRLEGAALLGDELLPPVSPSRAAALVPGRRGTLESRCRVSSERSVVPNRRPGMDERRMVITAWGTWPLSSPSADAPRRRSLGVVLEPLVLSRLVTTGMVVVDLRPTPWRTLLLGRRVGCGGRVVAATGDESVARALQDVVDENSLHDRVLVEPAGDVGDSQVARWIGDCNVVVAPDMSILSDKAMGEELAPERARPPIVVLAAKASKRSIEVPPWVTEHHRILVVDELAGAVRPHASSTLPLDQTSVLIPLAVAEATLRRVLIADHVPDRSGTLDGGGDATA